MDQEQYSPEQKKDITERVDKARTMLAELNLYPAATIHMINIGDDMFGTKVIPYLQDNKYTPTKSPIQPDAI